MLHCWLITAGGAPWSVHLCPYSAPEDAPLVLAEWQAGIADITLYPAAPGPLGATLIPLLPHQGQGDAHV